MQTKNKLLKYLSGAGFVTIMILLSSGKPISKNITKADYTKFVNPFIGTADNGHTFPGAALPFGFVQASPETGNTTWRYCSGYNYEDSLIIGFAQNPIVQTSYTADPAPMVYNGKVFLYFESHRFPSTVP